MNRALEYAMVTLIGISMALWVGNKAVSYTNTLMMHGIETLERAGK